MRHGGPAAPAPVAELARDAMALGLAALASDAAPTEALRWLERAHRLAPQDPNVMLTLASACLADDPARAAALFQGVADRHDVRQAWLGLGVARLRLAGADAAAGPVAALLSRFAFAADSVALAEAVGGRPDSPGWCALRSDGRLEIHAAAAAPTHVLLDGKRLRGVALPAGWERHRTIEVRAGDVPLFGSPIEVGAIRRIEGCVEACADGISGWAWHPHDPDTPPVLELRDGSGRRLRQVCAADETTVSGTGPLARSRAFRLSRTDLRGIAGPVHIGGPDGTDLLGSPLDPGIDEASHIAGALHLAKLYPAGPAANARHSGRGGSPSGPTVLPLRADAPAPARPVGADHRQRAVSIVIAVDNGGPAALESLNSVLASLPDDARVLVVGGGRADPDFAAALDRLRRRRNVAVLRQTRTPGLPAAAYAGIRAAKGRDVVLLSGTTLVPFGWLDRLRAAAYSAPDIGTVTPLSNEAGLLSYPGPAGMAAPDQTATNQLDRTAAGANPGAVIDIPVGGHFCLYLRRDCLNAVGSFRADRFAQGHGEATDFCLRARRLGWRNVAAAGVFVAQAGGTRPDAGAMHLQARNDRIIEQLHPGYQALIENVRARDPLAEARRRIDLHRWRARGRGWAGSAILITHDAGGGVEQRLSLSIARHEQAGRRPIVLRPSQTVQGDPAIAVRDGAQDDLPNLVYAMPQDLPALLRLLRAAKPGVIEAHHFADYAPAVYDLVRHLGVPYDVYVHDYAWFCPRVSLVGANGRYCGEPDLPDCEACVADHGHFLQEDITVAALRSRSAAFLAAARRVVVPSDDTGLRMRRHFEALATLTEPHEDDAALPVAAPSSAGRNERRRTSVCVVGAIGMHKGYDVLLACARDAARRDLDLEFVVVGHTIDDARMLATGRVFVTGRFEPHEAVDLIAEQNADIGFVASICPETWCLSLGEIWRAGLPAAAFDIGAPAERIRTTGRGIVLPLGLSASAINNALVAATWTTAHECSTLTAGPHEADGKCVSRARRKATRFSCPRSF
jgi:GT2 family glycosyltransferase